MSSAPGFLQPQATPTPRRRGEWLALGLLTLLLLGGVFAGVIYSMLGLAFGAPAPGMEKRDISPAMLPSILLLVLLLAATGIWLPDWLDGLIRAAASIVAGGIQQ